MPRVEDDDDSPWVYEGVGPPQTQNAPGRRQILKVMRRIGHDLNENAADYGPLHDPMVMLVENLARTCQNGDELERRLDNLARQPDQQGAAAALLSRIWRGYVSQSA
jgi:hypothetical protein